MEEGGVRAVSDEYSELLAMIQTIFADVKKNRAVLLKTIDVVQNICLGYTNLEELCLVLREEREKLSAGTEPKNNQQAIDYLNGIYTRLRGCSRINENSIDDIVSVEKTIELKF